jgi:hypothetical protein
MLPRSVAVLPCHLGWRTLLKCNKTNHAWQHFHQGAQDYKYRDFEGIVAATDGSVLNDPDEGLCIGGGICDRDCLQGR